jgi:hypothetical protein
MLSASRPNCPASSQQGPMSCRHTATQPHLEAWRLPKKLADFQMRVRDCVELYVCSPSSVKMSRSTCETRGIAHRNFCPNSFPKTGTGKTRSTSLRVTPFYACCALLQLPCRPLFAATYNDVTHPGYFPRSSLKRPLTSRLTLPCDARHAEAVTHHTDVSTCF